MKQRITDLLAEDLHCQATGRALAVAACPSHPHVSLPNLWHTAPSVTSICSATST